MADILVLKVISAGLKQEHNPAADSIKFSSFKTANYELTDTKLGKLVDGADAADEHIHDARYFRENEFLATSAGAGDAGKPIKLDAAGHVDATMINDADVSHDSTDGVANSTAHTAFPLLVGGRAFTQIQTYDNHKTFTSNTDIVDKKYVDDTISGALTTGEWQDSCLDIVLDPTALSPSTGDRYLINGTGAGDFLGHDYDIAEYNGTGWDFTTPTTGTRVGVDDESGRLYYFGGTGPWSAKYFESTTASLGCKKDGFDIQADLLAGGGLKLATNSLCVEPNDFAGSGLVDDGSDNLAIDWSTAFNDAKAIKASDLSATDTATKGSDIIGVNDANAYWTATALTGVLNEIWLQAKEGSGIEYVAGTGGIGKGDLCYVSANNTVLPLSTLTSDAICVGIATATVAESSSVKLVNLDSLLTGVLTSATAGTVYYWTGSAFATSMPANANENVWQVGVAKNATDLAVKVEHVKKNSATV